MFQKNQPKIMVAWSMYDWANSVYALVITSTIFPAFYENLTADPGNGSNLVAFFGWEKENTVLYSYSVSFSYLVTMLLIPFLTALADYSGRKKQYMQFFCYLGSAACAALFFFDSARLAELALIGTILASIGYNGSLVFYNAYLPEIVTEDKMDRLSARGFAMGYIGSVLLLLFNLAMIQQPQWFGISPQNQTLAPRISFLTVGVWWAAFAQIPFRNLPSNIHKRQPGERWLLETFREWRAVIRKVVAYKLLRMFLMAFFCYNLGVQTIMLLAPMYGKKEIGLETGELITTILLLQLIAIPGAYLTSLLSGRIGNFRALAWLTFFWVLICIGAYLTQTVGHFYVLATGVGFMMGGVQSLSRASYAKLIPPETRDPSTYFSFFDFTEKACIVLGTFLFGYLEEVFGTMRMSAMALGVFFLLGFVVLLLMPQKGSLAANTSTE